MDIETTERLFKEHYRGMYRMAYTMLRNAEQSMYSAIVRQVINVVEAFYILLFCDNCSEVLVKHMSHVWLTIVARMVDNCRAYG